MKGLCQNAEEETVMYFEDEFEKSFATQEELLRFLKAWEDGAAWIKMEASGIQILPMTEENCAGLETEETAGILQDTQTHTQLLVRITEGVFPLGSTAVKTLENRARISGKALSLLSKDRLSRILNECLQVSGGTALVRLLEGKIRAAHSGQYRILPMPEVFGAASEVIYRDYGQVSFTGGWIDHTRATARWEIGDPGLLEAYRKLITEYEGSCPPLLAQIRVTTSDTADSGANIFYSLLTGQKKHQIAMGMAVKLEHEGDCSIKKFAGNMEAAFSRYKESARDLEVLMHIHIRYPLNVMNELLRKMKIPADLKEETMQFFLNTNGPEECSAYEIYCGICESLYLAQGRGMGGYAMVSLEEEISGCLTVRYTAFDFPGELEREAMMKWAA